MTQIKVRKIGNSLGIILPKTSGVHDGDLLGYQQNKRQIILDKSETAREHDRKLIEASFNDFEKNNIVAEKTLKERFGKYGW